MQPLWIKEEINSNEKEATGTNGRIRLANEIPRQSRTIYKTEERKNSIEIHGIPENVYTSTEYAVLEVAEALNAPVVAEDMETFRKN